MFHRVLPLLALVTSLVVAGHARADTYDVQIGAFKRPDASALTVPAGVGELRGVQGDDGLTRFVVGPFTSRAAADDARDQLRAAGYPGAFVRMDTNGAAQLQERPAAFVAEEPTASVSMSDDEPGELVTLDGKLHRKIGDRFIPVEE
ncbi:MAG: SPOR domain-containing protein [Pseudomonadota bacterium]